MRFIFQLKCSLNSCGDVAYASGSGSVDQRYSFQGDAEYYEAFTIKSFFPAPCLAQVPEDCPYKVQTALEKSYALYWPDVGAAANALRGSLEFLLDALKIPRSQKDKSDKQQRISLHKRIELAADQLPTFKSLFLALKEVGNLGSHGGDVTDHEYSASLEIYEYVLTQIYGKTDAVVQELAKQLTESVQKKTLLK